MKKRFLPVFFICGLLFFAHKATAQGGTLPLNNKVNGNLAGDVDIWNLTTTADGLLRFTLTTQTPTDLYMSLYDNNGTLIGGPVESYNSFTATLSADGLAKGNYQVKVNPFSTLSGHYTLADSLFISSIANDPEPNATISAALILPQNGSKTGHVGYYNNGVRDTTDWYKVTTTTDGLLRIYLSTERGSIYSNNSLDVNVRLYDNDGITQLGFVETFNGNGPATGMITTDGLAPGTYYVKVQSFSTDQFANYTISDTLFTSRIANDAEPNKTRATAVVLPLNGKKTGHVGYYYNNLRDTADWYKVTTTSDGLLRIYLSTERGSIYSNNSLDVNVGLYDNDGVTQLSSVETFNGNGPASGLVSTDGLAPGTYYVKVQPFSTDQFANYTISDTLFTSRIANDAESNKTRATALVLPLKGKKNRPCGLLL